MKQNFNVLYEIHHDYENEDVQNKYYNLVVDRLSSYNDNIPFNIIVNFKAAMIAADYGVDSKYYKYLTKLTSFDKSLVDFFLYNHNITSFEVKETHSKELGCCLKDVWINGKYVPSEYRKY